MNGSVPFGSSLPFRLTVAAAALVLSVICWHALCLMPLVQWNPARLASSFALSRGLPIYALRDSGAHLGWFYGPVFPLWHLPATFFANPTHALLVAGISNILTWLLPIAAVLRAAGLSRSATWSGTIVGGALMAGHSISNYSFYFVHVDAVCLALQLTACLSLLRFVRTGSRGALHLCALALAGAFWTKVIAISLLPALVCWLWHERRRDAIRPLLFWSLVHGAAISAAVLAAFGPEEVLFNTWLVHARNPWRGGLLLLAQELGRLLAASAVWLPAVAFVWWTRRNATAPLLNDPSRSLLRLLLWSAGWLAPLGLVAVLKAGGGLNSVHSMHYLFLAGLVVLCLAFNLPAARRAVSAGLFLLAVVLPACAGTRLILQSGMRWVPDRSQEELLAAARRNPGRCYFPWSPMITIIAERRISPLDDALYCLWLSKLEPPADRIRAAAPPDPIIMYLEPAQSRFALRYFKSDPPASHAPPAP